MVGIVVVRVGWIVVIDGIVRVLVLVIVDVKIDVIVEVLVVVVRTGSILSQS